MNSKIKFLEVVLSDLVSIRDTMELELNRVLNDDVSPILDKKHNFRRILGEISETNNQIQILSEYLNSLTNIGGNTENNNNV